MLYSINGKTLTDLLCYGANSLQAHRDLVNDLNVFPVPDGDTGTNMFLTVQSGIQVLSDSTEDLAAVASKFAGAVTLSARGNSGVILSQFFKGMASGMQRLAEASPEQFLISLESGVSSAYKAVANPVEGTMLTVLKDGTNAVRQSSSELESIDDVVRIFLDEARVSLENTPNLLPILKQSGVIDSGGAGAVYFFEGVQRYLKGESLEDVSKDTSPVAQTAVVDYSLFDRNSTFDFGYCTELLIQLLNQKREFHYEEFKRQLSHLGESIVTSENDDKIKVHIHTKTPEVVLQYCHQFGEFLTLKIENMSVQHTEIKEKGIICAEPEKFEAFAVVAVAPDTTMRDLFLEMGADAVITCPGNPSSQDFLDAFELVEKADSILVFPNNSNSILAAEHAAELFEESHVVVIESKTIAECYSALPMIDYSETDIDLVKKEILDGISNIMSVTIAQAIKDASVSGIIVHKDDFIALSGKSILRAGQGLANVTAETILTVLENRPTDVITIFMGKDVDENALLESLEIVHEKYLLVEIQTVPTGNDSLNLLLSFE